MDGTDSLCVAVYGAKDIRKVLGGNEASMLYDGARLIAELRAELAKVTAERDEAREFGKEMAGCVAYIFENRDRDGDHDIFEAVADLRERYPFPGPPYVLPFEHATPTKGGDR